MKSRNLDFKRFFGLTPSDTDPGRGKPPSTRFASRARRLHKLVAHGSDGCEMRRARWTFRSCRARPRDRTPPYAAAPGV